MNKDALKGFGLGVYLVVVAIILVWCLLALWHEEAGEVSMWDSSAALRGSGLMICPELRMIMLVMLAGGLGSWVHAAISFATYMGNKSFVPSWCWWYILMPPIGMALAVVFYFAMRGGILVVTSQSEVGEMRPFALAAISGLVGLSSMPATEKLRDLFGILFNTEDSRKP